MFPPIGKRFLQSSSQVVPISSDDTKSKPTGTTIDFSEETNIAPENNLQKKVPEIK
jgi:hypothetical protein